MKISEITHQTNEAWLESTALDTARSWMQGQRGSKESVLMLGVAGALYNGFISTTRLAGVRQPTAEDLAQYLLSARVADDAIRRSMMTHFKTGFKDFEEPTGADSEEQPVVSGQPVANDPNDPTTWTDANNDGEDDKTGDPITTDAGDGTPQNPYVNDRSGDKETFVQKLKRKMKNKFGGNPNRLKPNPDATVRLPPGVNLNQKPGQTARSRNMDKNSLDFVGKSLIAEAPTVIPDKIAKLVIRTALKHQSRIGSMNKLIIPAHAGQPSLSAQAMFQKLEKEMDDDYKPENDPENLEVADQHIKNIAGQIKAMSANQRAKLTTAISAPDPTTTDEFGADQPAVKPDADGNK